MLLNKGSNSKNEANSINEYEFVQKEQWNKDDQINK